MARSPHGLLLAPHLALALGLALGLAAGCGVNGTPPPRRDGGVDAAVGLDASTGDDAFVPPRDAAPRTDAGDVCGDGTRGITESCDDHGTAPGDGCSATCTIEDGFRCPAVGPCRPIVCGDRMVEAPERCDDGDTSPGDGCSTGCQIESGWACPIAGVACSAAMCGDTIVAGLEQCDDGGAAPGDGCGADCRLEAGYVCTPGAGCRATTCGDGVREGSEQCDDHNVRAFDGCDPFCNNEPACSGGTCSSVCGDGVILPGGTEQCDDGNVLAGDGCSATCTREDGFTCDLVAGTLPDRIRLPVVYRDFRGISQTGAPIHEDFDARGGSGITFSMTTDTLDAEGRPAWSGIVVGGSGANSAASFHDWYRDSSRNTAVLDFLTLDRIGTTSGYQFDSGAAGFFPLDGRGWNGPTSSAPETYSTPHNYSFTTETHTWFVYQGTERLDFTGDDDVWVFVDGHLCLDVGGLHPPETATMDFANPGSAGSPQQTAIVTACAARLTPGRVYEMVVFHAERRCCGSNFHLALTGFVTETSSCRPTCGDGVVTRFELCDDGAGNNTGAYGRCGTDCLSRGPYCGDGHVDAGHEACDEGTDANDGHYGGCNPDCTEGPRCGDGVRQGAEQCDAGAANGTPGASCDAACNLTIG